MIWGNVHTSGVGSTNDASWRVSNCIHFTPISPTTKVLLTTPQTNTHEISDHSANKANKWKPLTKHELNANVKIKPKRPNKNTYSLSYSDNERTNEHGLPLPILHSSEGTMRAIIILSLRHTFSSFSPSPDARTDRAIVWAQTHCCGVVVPFALLTDLLLLLRFVSQALLTYGCVQFVNRDSLLFQTLESIFSLLFLKLYCIFSKQQINFLCFAWLVVFVSRNETPENSWQTVVCHNI